MRGTVAGLEARAADDWGPAAVDALWDCLRLLLLPAA